MKSSFVGVISLQVISTNSISVVATSNVFVAASWLLERDSQGCATIKTREF